MEIMAARDDVTVRIDTELRAKAKELDINMSRLFEDTLRNEIERRETRSALAAGGGSEEIRLELEDSEGRGYVGKFIGKPLGEAREIYVYIADDERLIVYDAERNAYYENPDDLEDWFPHDFEVYTEIMYALGETPEIDL